ncbi:MAG: DUF2848 domain-containing protein [Actinobacteria bacterium]|nr:DUF2848 domain-containing protein [Actinomycetota bacterium]
MPVTALALALGAGEPRAVEVDTAIVAGWTGRDLGAVEAHIAELAELGVPRPSATPIFYRVSASRLTTAAAIESTPDSSGEVEAVLLRAADELWVGAGSDHTDRRVEAYDVAVSKQMCEKPIAARFWPYAEVADHWDDLVIRSWIEEDGAEVLYQEGTMAAIRPAAELVERAQPALADGTLMFLGTVAARGGIRPSPSFRYELADPVLGRSITSRYAIRALPLIS